jgi:hypothetical protein
MTLEEVDKEALPVGAGSAPAPFRLLGATSFGIVATLAFFFIRDWNLGFNTAFWAGRGRLAGESGFRRPPSLAGPRLGSYRRCRIWFACGPSDTPLRLAPSRLSGLSTPASMLRVLACWALSWRGVATCEIHNDASGIYGHATTFGLARQAHGLKLKDEGGSSLGERN